MVTLTQPFESGTNGASVTAGQAGNSAGVGNYLDLVNIVSGGQVAYTTDSLHGKLAVVTSTGTTTTSGAYFGWSTQLGSVTSLFGRAAFKVAAAPGTTDAVIEFLNSGSFSGAIQLTTTLNLAIQNAAFGTVATMATTLTAGTFYRVEWSLTASASTGQLTVWLYIGDSTVPTETYVSAATQNFAAACSQVQAGWNNGHANQPAITWDDFAVSTTGKLGPAVPPTTVPWPAQQWWPQLMSPMAQANPLLRFQPWPPSEPLYATAAPAAVTVNAGAASGTGAASPPAGAVSASAGSAAGTGSAGQPGAGQTPYVVASAGVVSGSSSYTIPVTTASKIADGLTVVIGSGGTSPPAVTSVTDSQGQKYTQLQQGTGAPFIAVFEAPGDIALSTSDTLTITFAAATTGGSAINVIGTPGMRTVDVNAVATGNSGTASVSGTTAYAGEMALACMVWANTAGTGTLGGGFTQLAQAHPSGGTYSTAGFQARPAAGSVTATASITSAAWRAVLVTLRPLPQWYLTNSRYIHEMYQNEPASASAAFNTPSAFALSNDPTATGIQDSFTCTPVLKYVSYAQLQADVGSGAITAGYSWLMYDNEYVDDGAGGNSWGTPMSEANDPWTAMGNFVTYAHAHGFKVILAPARDLGNNANLVTPKNAGETLDAWYLRTNIAGTGAATGAEVMHVQAQADTVPTSSFTGFWGSALAQIAAGSATCQASVGVSTTYGAASDMAAAAKAVQPAAWGYWLNATDATIGQASQFLDLMQGGQAPSAPAVSGVGSANSATAAVTVAAPVAGAAGTAPVAGGMPAAAGTAPVAGATGSAPTPSGAASASAGAASGTGAAPAPSVTTTASTSPSAGSAAGTGSAPAPVIAAGVSAGSPSGSGSVSRPAVAVTASAGAAAGSGPAPAPSAQAAVNAGGAAGAGAGPAASVSTVAATSASAGSAAGAGTAPAMSPAVTVAAGGPGGQGQAGVTSAAAAAITATPAGAGSAPAGVASPGPVAGAAAGSGTTPQLGVAAAASVAAVASAGAGIGPAPVAAVAAAASQAAGSGAAPAPSVTTVPQATVAAPAAAGAGSAAASLPAVTVTAGSAAGSGSSPAAGTGHTVTAGAASGTSGTLSPTTAHGVACGQAIGSGSAAAPSTAETVSPPVAAGAGASPGPVVQTSSQVNAPAGSAAGSGAAPAGTAAIGTGAGAASGQGTGPAVTIAITPAAGQSAGAGSAPVPKTALVLTSGPASGAGSAPAAAAASGAVAGAGTATGSAGNSSPAVAVPAHTPAGAGSAPAPSVQAIPVTTAAAGLAAGQGAATRPGLAATIVAPSASGTGNTPATTGQPTLTAGAPVAAGAGAAAVPATLLAVLAQVAAAAALGEALTAEAKATGGIALLAGVAAGPPSTRWTGQDPAGWWSARTPVSRTYSGGPPASR